MLRARFDEANKMINVYYKMHSMDGTRGFRAHTVDSAFVERGSFFGECKRYEYGKNNKRLMQLN